MYFIMVILQMRRFLNLSKLCIENGFVFSCEEFMSCLKKTMNMSEIDIVT